MPGLSVRNLPPGRQTVGDDRPGRRDGCAWQESSLLPLAPQTNAVVAGDVEARGRSVWPRSAALCWCARSRGEWRAVDIFETDRLNEARSRRLVKSAIAYNRSNTKVKKSPVRSARAGGAPAVKSRG